MLPSVLLTALKEGFQKLLDRLDKVISAIGGIKMNEAVAAQTSAFSKALSRIEAAVDKIKDPIFSGEVTIDTGALEAEVSAALAELKKLDIPSVANIETTLKLILTTLNSPKDETKELAAILAVEKAIKDLKLPTTFNIDQNQMRALTGSMKAMPTNPGQLAARNVALTNLALTSASTEYSFVFPANTVSWTIKLRDQGTLGYYSFTSGKMPAGGDSTNYATIPQNFLQSKEGVDWSGKSIYLGAEAATQVAEITVYTL